MSTTPVPSPPPPPPPVAFRIPSNDVQLSDETIGHGRYQQLVLGTWNDKEVLVAKYLKFTDSKEQLNLEQSFNRELDVRRSLNHENIVVLLAFCHPDQQNPDELKLLVMERMDQNLEQLIQSARLDLGSKVDLLLQISRGVQYLHENGVFHRDLKPSNIMLKRMDDSNGQKKWLCKVSGFGISKQQMNSAVGTTGIIGTASYCSPELYLNQPSGARSDVYSAAMTFFQLLTGRLPYEGSQDLLNQSFKDESVRPEFKPEDGVPVKLQQLVQRMWSADKLKRPYFVETLAILNEVMREMAESTAGAGGAEAAPPVHADESATEDLDVLEVVEWLAELGLDDYKDTFSRNKITRQHLVDLTRVEEKMKEMGIKAKGDQIKIRRGIEPLKQATDQCKKIADGLFERFQKSVDPVQATLRAGQTVRNFGVEHESLCNGLLDKYDRRTSSCLKSVAKRTRLELKSKMHNQLHQLFEIQVKLLVVQANAQLTTRLRTDFSEQNSSMKDIESQEEAIQKIYSTASKIRDYIDWTFRQQADESLVVSAWPRWSYESELAELMQSVESQLNQMCQVRLYDQVLSSYSDKRTFEAEGNLPNPHGSFAPERNGINAHWYIDGAGYFAEVADELEKAKEQIFITDWSLNPELYLRRPEKAKLSDRLDQVLLAAAKRGVKVYVLLWFNSPLYKAVGSEHAMSKLTGLHDNVQVMRHPCGKDQLIWSHHQKMVVIDQRLAFIGGLDLCYGRWDDGEHSLVDDCHLAMRFPGKDYYNPRLREFEELHRPYDDPIDRSVHPRMPWHDICCRLDGEAAYDVATNFVQRWNHHLGEQIADSKRTVNYQKLQPKGEPTTPASGRCRVQLLRSIGGWSLGLASKESSVHTAYLNLINRAEHFIYIENQYFISVENGIADALFDRIKKAIENDQTFRVVVFVPLTPSGPVDDPANRNIMRWQYETINRGGFSLIERLRRLKVCPEDYITFCSLAKHSSISGQPVWEQIYIHSKLMIVDDRVALIGSANINDRSMLGDRDSEIAAVVLDEQSIESVMNGAKCLVSKFAHELRVKLWREHLDATEKEVRDPIADTTYHTLLRGRARNNSQVLSAVFPGMPSNSIRTLAEYRKRHEQPPRETNQLVDPGVKGHAILYPLDFLVGGSVFEAVKSWRKKDFSPAGSLPSYVYQ